MTHEEAQGYLAGVIDGEGYVCFNAAWSSRWIEIGSMDLDLFEAYKRALDTLEIPYTTSIDAHLFMRVFIGTQEGLIAVYERIPIQSNRKKEKLGKALASYKRKPYTLAKEE